MTTLTVTATHDYHLEDLTGTDTVLFSPATFATLIAVFSSAQFGSQISNTLNVIGSAFQSIVQINMSAAGTFSAAGWTFSGSYHSEVAKIVGTGGADTIIGSSGRKIMIGGDGADHMIGGASEDDFDYSLGSEVAPGEAIDGGDGVDWLVIFGGAGEDFDFSVAAISNVENFRFNAGGPSTATFSGDQIGASAISSVNGESYANHLVVLGAAVDLSGVVFHDWDLAADTIAIYGTSIFGNTLLGSNQNESFDAAPGSRDFMRGRGGNDIYFVDHPLDFVDESDFGGSGFDIVYSSISFSLVDPLRVSGAIEELVLTGTADINAIGNNIGDLIIGNNGDNLMNGGGGGDTLRGRDGNDSLNGGTGNDTLTGGAHNDRFQFNTALNPASNVDHIIDFSHPADTIVLSHAVFTQIAVGALAAAALRAGTTAADPNDRLIYDQPTGRLWYDPDGTGVQAKVLFAVLDNHTALNATDFLVTA